MACPPLSSGLFAVPENYDVACSTRTLIFFRDRSCCERYLRSSEEVLRILESRSHAGREHHGKKGFVQRS